MRNYLRRAALAAAMLACVPAFAQNESESAKSGLKAPVMSAPPPAVPAEQRVTMQPGTNVVNAAAAQKLGGVPQFQVDPFWPKPLPNNWILGQVSGVAVDKRGHVWIIHRPRSLSEREVGAQQNPPWSKCCYAAPPVLVFDDAGNLLRAWGGTGAGYEWPETEHGIFIDDNDFVWTAGSGNKDSQILKFTLDGKFVLQIGKSGQSKGSNDTANLGSPADLNVDTAAREVYVADGYRNRRVIVFDINGKYLRHWGAYGNVPDDTDKFDPKTMMSGALPKQFSTPHGITGSNDGKIYVADRRGNRVQVFDHQGKFLAEKVIAPATLSSGSAFVPVLSPDAQQTWLYVADGTNHKVWILRRSDLEIVGEFGRGGRQLGQFLRPHGMSIDNQGNLYVGEASTGRRVQRFLLQKR